MKAYPPVVIVDDQDRVLGAAPLADAWKRGLIHRIVFVILEDAQGRVLLQKRAPTMKLFPNRWDISAGGHVDVSPNYKTSAWLEMKEELGIGDLPLQEVAHVFADEPYDNGVAARRFITIFRAHCEELPNKLGDYEVSWVQWWEKRDVIALAAEHPEQIAEGLRRCLPYLLAE